MLTQAHSPVLGNRRRMKAETAVFAVEWNARGEEAVEMPATTTTTTSPRTTGWTHEPTGEVVVKLRGPMAGQGTARSVPTSSIYMGYLPYLKHQNPEFLSPKNRQVAHIRFHV